MTIGAELAAKVKAFNEAPTPVLKVFRDGWNNENPTKKGARDMSAGFQMVEIDRLYESATNPRRKFHGLDELTASVKQHGVLTPLLVRPAAGTDGNLEIIAGARRYRAATAAKITEIPVRIKEMSDHEALELQIIENLQRRDVHPLDEGLGYKRLEAMGDTVEDIAAKVNKSESYVYQRMKLAALTEAWQELFLADEITPGHAVQIARLNPQHQKELLRDMKTEEMTVRQLGEHIANNYHLRLADSPFPLDDATLLPAAGACKTCPKRSGANPLLFPDVKAKDTCADPICFNQKVTAFVAIQTEAHPEALKLSVGHHYDRKPKFETGHTVARGKKCDHTIEAVVAEVLDPYAAKREGMKLGQVVSICTDKKCKDHHQQVPERSDYNSSTGGSRKADKKRKLELKRRGAIFKAMMLRPFKEPAAAEVKQLLAWAIQCLASDQSRALCNAMGWEPKKDRYGQRNYQNMIESQLLDKGDALGNTYMVSLAARQLWFFNNTTPGKPESLEDAAERRGVDLKAVAKELEEPAKKEPKPKAEAKPPKAKKPAKAKKAKKKAA